MIDPTAAYCLLGVTLGCFLYALRTPSRKNSQSDLPEDGCDLFSNPAHKGN